MSDLRANSQVADGIHWLKNGYVNSYIIENGYDLILIDTALRRKANGILEYIKKELESRKVAKIILTHHHLDHTRGLHYLHHTFFPRVFSSKEDASVITGKRKSPLPRSIILKPIFFVLRPFISAKIIPSVEFVKDGDLIDDILIHHLPGHTIGSLGFQKNKVLFSGDAAVSNAKGEVVLGVKTLAESMSLAIASFKRLATFNFDMMLPGHGKPIIEDGSVKAKEAIKKLSFKNYE